jgi:uncharacterized protein with FMN-binding domain
MTTSKPSLLRRAAPAIVIGVAAVAVVSRFDSGAAALVSAAKANNGTSGSSSSTNSTGVSGSTGSSSNGSGTSGSASNSGSGDSTASCGKQVTGSTISIYEAGGRGGGNYGQIAVTAWVNNGKVCKVSTNYQAYDGRSQMIDQSVVPTLDSEAVQAGNANISMISGATYTSQAYAQSLQSAIDKA